MMEQGGEKITGIGSAARGGGADVVLLSRYLADRDVPCPVCKYNLRNVMDAVCPECGDPIALAISLKAPKNRAQAVTMTFLVIAAGYAWLAVIAVLHLGFTAPRATFYATNTFILAANALILTVGCILVRNRTQVLQRLSLRDARRFMWASISGVIVLAFMTWQAMLMVGEPLR